MADDTALLLAVILGLEVVAVAAYLTYAFVRGSAPEWAEEVRGYAAALFPAMVSRERLRARAVSHWRVPSREWTRFMEAEANPRGLTQASSHSAMIYNPDTECEVYTCVEGVYQLLLRDDKVVRVRHAVFHESHHLLNARVVEENGLAYLELRIRPTAALDATHRFPVARGREREARDIAEKWLSGDREAGTTLDR